MSENAALRVMKCIELNWLCKHMKKVRSSQASILVLNWVNHSFPQRVLFIWKDYVTYMHVLAVYIQERLSFTQDLSLEHSADSYFCFQLALLHSLSHYFFLYWSHSSSLYMVFNSISSNIDEIHLTNPSSNAFVFRDFNVHQRTG